MKSNNKMRQIPKERDSQEYFLQILCLATVHANIIAVGDMVSVGTQRQASRHSFTSLTPHCDTSIRSGILRKSSNSGQHCYHGSTDCLPQEANTGTRVPNNPHHQPTISYFTLLKLPQTLSLKPAKMLKHTSHNRARKLQHLFELQN